MKTKTLINKFWKNIFGSKEPQIKKSKEEEISKQNLQNSPSLIEAESTNQLSSTKQQSHEIISPSKEKPFEQSPKSSSEEFKPDKKNAEADIEEKSKPSLARSELNLEQNCIFTVSTYREKSREIVLVDTGLSGEIHERRAIVGRTIDGIETGVLTTGHFKLYLALVKLWEASGKPVNETVHFTILRIIRTLGMINSGSNYEMIKRNLINLRQIPIMFINSFYITEEGVFRTLEPFTILSRLRIYERRKVGKGQKTYGYGEFRFDDNILESLINNHTHPLRLDVINSFKKHKDLSILLYTYLDRNLAIKDKYEIGLEKLFDHLDLSQEQVRYPSDRKAKLKPVLDQLRGKELSTGILSHAEVVKTVDGKDYKLVCRKKPFPKKLKCQPAQLTLPIGTEPDKTEIPESPDPGSELFPLLIGKGLTEKQAAKLISEKGPEVIRTQVEYLPFRIKDYMSQGKEINEPAILYDSISDNWNVPKSYIDSERLKEREARKIESERIALEEREEWDRAEQERERIKAYKESLDPDDRAKLREKALKEIKGMEGVKEGFITDILIEFKENEILREEVEEDKS